MATGQGSSCPDWIAEIDQANAFLGSSVAGAGDVNGDGYDELLLTKPVRVFMGSSSGPSTSAAWTSEGRSVASDQPSSAFGILASADVNATAMTTSWSAHLGSATGLSTSPAWVLENGNHNPDYEATLGHDVAAGDLNGDGYGDVLVGSLVWFYSEAGIDGDVETGRAYAYLGSSSGLSTSASWVADHDQGLAKIGYARIDMETGDVNGDGTDDVIVGTLGHETDEYVSHDEGRAYVYLGSPSGPSPAPVWTAEGHQDLALFGDQVASACDVDGDGYDDVLIGSPGYSGRQPGEGRGSSSAARRGSSPARCSRVTASTRTRSRPRTSRSARAGRRR